MVWKICPGGTTDDKGGTEYQALVLGKEQERDGLNISGEGRKPGTIIRDFITDQLIGTGSGYFFFPRQQEEVSVGHLFQ